MNIHFKTLFSFKKKEIDAAFKSARMRQQTRGLKLLQAPFADVVRRSGTKEDRPTHGKLLIITSRAVGKAHDRNRIRRQLKAIFYEEQLYTQPIISILIVYKQALELDFNQLKRFLRSAFSQALR